MKNSFLRRIDTSSIKQLCFAIIIIAAISLIPLLKSYGRINVGGDTFIPFLPEHSYKMTYEWLDRSNGEYFTNNYRVWLLILNPLKAFGLSIYQSGFILQFLIFFLAGFGMYKIFCLISGKYSLFGLIPAAFYILSPHLLDHQLYQIGTIGIVWVTYYFVKFVKYRKFTFTDAIFTNVFLASIIDLPNPKYHFLLAITVLLILIFSLFLRLIKTSDIGRNFKNFLALILLSSYILLPILYFAYSFSKYNSEEINIRQSYGVSGETLDYGVAHINKMMRLFHTPNLDVATGKIIQAPLYFFAYYMIPIIILGIFPLAVFKSRGREKRFYLLFYLIGLLLIFMTKGSNPPFGFLYERILSSSQLFSFMRTTAGIVIYAAVFYALIYGLLFHYLYKNTRQKYLLTIIFTAFILIWGYPFWSGRYFLNKNPIATQKNKYGMSLPISYFQAASFLEPYKLDSKIGIYPPPSGYQQNTWGYYGFIFYPWLINQPTIYFDNTNREGRTQSRVNLRFILHDRTLVLWGVLPNIRLPSGTKLIFRSNMIDIYRLPDQIFLPHFYTSKENFITNKIPQSFLIAQNNSMGFFSLRNSPELLVKIPKVTNSNPILEYKKINPTKYRVIIHGAKNTFPLIFNENYRPEWKLYLGDMREYGENKTTLKDNTLNFYKVFNKNENEQATKEEVINFIKRGFISTLGNLNEKQNKTFSYPHSVRSLTNVENYRIDFISKNFSNTIQNNNLPNKYFYETFVSKEIISNHLIANNFFNSWLIDVNQICQKGRSCIKNPDGSYDMEFVIEFWPQKLLNLGIVITTFTLFGYFAMRLFLGVIKMLIVKKPN